MASSIITPRTCRTCGHCEAPVVRRGETPGDIGECHGAPPQIVVLPMPGPDGKAALSIQTHFPRVELDWSCGTWKPRITVVTQ